MKFLLIGLIKVYCYLISPLIGQNCRFHPTCSAYVVGALETHGVLKGLWLGMRRLLKCHPWHSGHMLDPVPSKAKSSSTPIAWRQLISYKRGASK